MLWRALKHVEKGFYIDVGAWSPLLDSVTKAFYDRGWRGINIEPNPEFHRELQEARPRDASLCVALSDAPGTGTLNVASNSGLSTLDEEVARTHLKAGHSFERKPVEVATLEQLWIEHVPADQAVHFLKIDVEGYELRVLRGNDWSRYRPWIVVVEATYPSSRKETYHAWEPILEAHDYQLAYADGLNRFYVASEHLDLKEALRYPPNHFDGFKQYSLVRAENEIANLKKRAQALQTEVAELRRQRDAARAEKDQLRERRDALEGELARLKERVDKLRAEFEKRRSSGKHSTQAAGKRSPG